MSHVSITHGTGNRPRRWLAILSVLLALAMVLMGQAPAHAAILAVLYASPTGLTSGACDDWSVACTLQYALTVAGGDFADDVIFIEEGTYIPDPSSRFASFGLQDNTSLYGGYASTPDHTRDLVAHATILSGDLLGNDAPGFLNMSDNSYSVVTANGVDNTALLDGVTIKSGNANLKPNADGGGVYLGTGSPTLSNLLIESNYGLFGGGMSVGSGNPSLTDVTFSGNAALVGAGMTNMGSPSLSHVTFINNAAASVGGGLHNYSGSPVLTDVTFTGNTVAAATQPDGNGGGLYVSTGTVELTNSTFYNNSVSLSGGYGGGIYNKAGLTLTNVTFNGNAAAAGGALYNDNSSPTIVNTIFWGDAVSGAGPEIWDVTSAPSIDHSVVQAGCGIISGATCTNLVTADPKLGPLANNGGFNQTIALLAGSSAIDAGDDTTCANSVLQHDQRGVSRPRGAHCDIGAYERIPANASLGSGYQTDVGVFRPSTGGWFVKNLLATTFGLNGDDPLPFDFNGDGVSDVAVYRPSSSAWYVKNQFATPFGFPGDVPVPGDYDGNRTADVAVYRPSTSAWYVKNQFSTIYGLAGDIPVPGDYNGDGITDVAVFRPSTGAWFVKNQFSAIFGLAGDIPVPGDYNGDGITDLAVFRPSTHAWFVRGQFSTIYGATGDIPVPGDYKGDGTTDIAVNRPSTSGWFVRNQLSTIYGLTGDYPLPAPDTNADGNPYQ